MELQNEMERKTDGMEKKKGDRRQLLALFLGTLYISAFTFGGGFVIVTFMKKKFVDELHWIDEKEMLDFTALAQASLAPLPSMRRFWWAGRSAVFSGCLRR